MTRPILTFLGGTGTVTGSKFLVQEESTSVLVDAGLYQGVAELRRKNWQQPPVDPGELDAVVLTHAHLDHCGYLPRLARDGFRGPVLCTEQTSDLATIVLQDSAHLQEEDAAYANAMGYSKHRPALPLYDEEDVLKLLPQFKPVGYGERVQIGPDVAATLRPAGHILGSATVLLEAGGARAVFSGDLGRPRHPLLPPPAPPPAADVVVVESTYGDRVHPPQDPGLLADAVRRTIGRGGTVLIPAFAVDRTELVLMELRRLMGKGEIPRVPVYADSPMALATLRVYRRALHDPALVRVDLPHGDPFDPGDLHAVHSPAESEQLNRPGRPCIIVSASGMATGGRVVHHLEHQLADPRNCVVLTGYQAAGTRGRQLVEGARVLKMHGRYIPVRAEVVEVPHFSVHADAAEIVAWLRQSPVEPSAVYVVHGEPDASAALAERIRDELGWCAAVPRLGERVRLD
ncbi:MAG TPA: MBL fold metallo-hydrolase [Marmoricola sp.]|nr:MBL fold metallo-hydrolase [Marmoricola sp.]